MWIVVASGISGIAGVVVASLLQGRRDRDEQFRGRMLQAADDYSTAVVHALLLVTRTRESASALGRAEAAETPSALATHRLRLTEALDAVNAAHRQLARVELLFRQDDPAAEAAAEALVEMRYACAELNFPHVQPDAAKPRFDAAHRAHTKFNRAARDEIRSGALTGSRVWVTRRVGRWRPTGNAPTAAGDEPSQGDPAAEIAGGS